MDPTLDFMSRCLLEEEIDELNITAQKDDDALREIEKPFYEILGQKYPFSLDKQPVAPCQSEADISSTFCISKAPVGFNSTSKQAFLMDPTLDFISRYLLEEEIDELNITARKDDDALREIEKPFYEILGQKYPFSLDKQLVAPCQSEADSSSTFCISKAQVGFNSTSKQDFLMDPTLDFISRCLLEEEIDELNITAQKDDDTLREIEKPFYEILGQKYPFSLDKQPVAPCQSEADSSSTFCNSKAQVGFNSTSKISVHDSFIGTTPVMEFHKGIEEGLKFLPNINILATDIKEKMISVDNAEVKDENSVGFKLVEKENVRAKSRSMIKRSIDCRDLDTLEGPNRKMSMIYSEEPNTDDVYDRVLLDHGEDHMKEEIWGLREILQKEASSNCKKKQVQICVHSDLCTLLIHCSEAVAIYDLCRAQEVLSKIRIQSSRNGNGIQRLASVLADALEARLAGVGREYYHGLIAKQVSIPDISILKAYHLYLNAAPFARVSYGFSNHNILNAAKNARKLHVIDLGIRFGFQWPSLIQALAKREGGPPQLRITGIDFPEPGFRPAKRIKDMGRRFEEYARSFSVPFEYKAIASSQWELIHIEDLNINDDEVVIVNSMLRFKKVKDESFEIDSQRNRVLKLIREIKPRVFIFSDVCRSYSPNFLTRFRQVLSTYSVFFDLLDTTIPRGNKERQLPENMLFVHEIINIIACEGSDWIERPETLKQWQRRSLRAGFEQLSVDPYIVKECNDLVRNFYDKQYFIEEDENWLVEGWKGRVLFGVTAWKPKLDEGC
ncbi:scarecrow-like protein 34 [Carex rostrata]